jgi:hypothetical protein
MMWLLLDLGSALVNWLSNLIEESDRNGINALLKTKVCI